MRDPRKTVMIISLSASVLMLVGKVTAYVISHSAAIFSDAAESMVHGVATGLATFSLWYSSRPADAKHPYGHGRIAYFSAGFEGALVVLAGITVVYSSIRAWIEGRPLDHLGAAIGISAVLALINLFLGAALIRVGRRTNTLILVANGRHVLSDMWTTAASILGVSLVWVTGNLWLDPFVAICLGVYIFFTGAMLLRDSFIGLMDQIDPEITIRIVEVLQKGVDDGVISEFHQLRCRQLNDEIWAEVHLLVPGELAVSEGHARATRMEKAIRANWPQQDVYITSHVEPADHDAAHPGGHQIAVDPIIDAASDTARR
jgi:cation diffusion facilitator family transporter